MKYFLFIEIFRSLKKPFEKNSYPIGAQMQNVESMENENSEQNIKEKFENLKPEDMGSNFINFYLFLFF